MTKVLICGGRDYRDKRAFDTFMDSQHHVYAFTHVIHGGAPGADTLADEWALSRGVQAIRCPANWDKHGKSAGPIRNRRMAELLPDWLYAFPGGRGTANMIATAKERGIDVMEVSPVSANEQ